MVSETMELAMQRLARIVIASNTEGGVEASTGARY
jgi:hypothetical protein